MYDAIVLAGGRAIRLGGIDKAGLEVGGVPLLARVLRAVPDAGSVVCVGPTRVVSRAPGRRPVEWCREQPPGSGPVAALATGLSRTSAQVVVVLAADLPAPGGAVPVLLSALDDRSGSGKAPDAAVLVDADGRINHLLAAWRRRALDAALAAVGDPAGAPMRALLDSRGPDSAVRVPDAGGWGVDCDTWDDVAAARARAGEAEPVR